MTTRKTHTTAVVLIPPEAIWPQVQELRRVHDRNFERWMPHITLLYPFAEQEDFAQVVPHLASAAAGLQSFHLSLSRFHHFRHRRNCTMFLIPAPEAPVIDLHTHLIHALPDYDDTAKYPGGFHPHLSVGQFQHRHVKRDQGRFQAEWTPIQFRVETILLIYRAPETDNRFIVAEIFPLSG
ncbi:MAG: 2'-5' RNA ligase family protein [Candidatus Poribacteria bacterium]|nr:2'-5' RNA ligase family protein [Candidatus Poribacteria bacterium]